MLLTLNFRTVLYKSIMMYIICIFFMKSDPKSTAEMMILPVNVFLKINLLVCFLPMHLYKHAHFSSLQIEELASTLSYGSRSSSLDSLSSLDSFTGSPGSSPVPRGASPLHNRFRLSAKKALLLWVRDQCQK